MLRGKRRKMVAAQTYQPTRHPTVAMKTPPRTDPTENPSGWPTPVKDSPTLRNLPGGIVFVSMLTCVGSTPETATPCSTRNAIN